MNTHERPRDSVRMLFNRRCWMAVHLEHKRWGEAIVSRSSTSFYQDNRGQFLQPFQVSLGKDTPDCSIPMMCYYVHSFPGLLSWVQTLLLTEMNQSLGRYRFGLCFGTSNPPRSSSFWCSTDAPISKKQPRCILSGWFWTGSLQHGACY